MPDDDAEDTASQAVTPTGDETTALSEGWRWCEQALDAIRVAQLTSTPELLADSYQALQEKSFDLKRLAMVREVLDRMAPVQGRAERQWQKIARKLGLDARLAEAERVKDDALDRITRGEFGTEDLTSTLAHFQLILSVAKLDQALMKALEKRDKIRKSARRVRRIGGVAHQLTFPLVGILLGVVVVQLVQDRIESSIHRIAAWVFAIVAWAVLDYVLEPQLRKFLAQRSLKLLKKELDATFEAWTMLRALQESSRSEPMNLDDVSDLQLLPNLNTLTKGMAVSG
jgi:hypothetical protein